MSTGPLFPPTSGTGPLSLPQRPPIAEHRPSLFASPAFLLFWLRQGGATLGERVFQTALMWWTLQVTGSLTLTSFVLIGTTLPTVVLGPIAGAIADRVERKPLMAVTDALRAVLVAIACFLAVTHALTFPLAIAIATLLAVLGAFFMPASMALLPSVVATDDLLRANSLIESTVQGAGILGPALGGLLVAAVGASGAFGFDAATYTLSCLLLLAMPFPPRAKSPQREAFWPSMRAGFRVLVDQPAIGGVLGAFACMNFFTVPVLLFLPYFANNVFHAGARGLGLLEAAVAIGMTGGALAWARAGAVSQRRLTLALSVLLIGVCYVGLGLFPRFEAYLGALAIVGALIATLNVVVMAFFQERVPAAEMGRFMGVLTSLVFGLMPVSYGLFGLLSAHFAPEKLLLVNGGAIALVALLLWQVRGLDTPA
ncbi:MAG TPA: MFS transporter [Oscillatoriaceae cyanobacterium]